MRMKCKNMFIISSLIFACSFGFLFAVFFGVAACVLFMLRVFIAGFACLAMAALLLAYILDALNKIFPIDKILGFDFPEK